MGISIRNSEHTLAKTINAIDTGLDNQSFFYIWEQKIKTDQPQNATNTQEGATR